MKSESTESACAHAYKHGTFKGDNQYISVSGKNSYNEFISHVIQLV